MKKVLIVLFGFILWLNLAGEAEKEFYFRGALYQDWMGLKYEGIDMYSRLSSRLKLTLWNKPGDGWTGSVDVRNRYTLGEEGENQFIIYDARLSYNSAKSRIFFSIGQMNLYDTAGIGQLTGGVVGYKWSRRLSAGGYVGLEPDIYRGRWDSDYLKYGLFFRYLGTGAKQFSLSINHLGYDGQTERQYLYSSLLLPFKRLFVIYGNVEYELDKKIRSEDRLSRLFLNARVNITRYADITAHYSSGRGLDFHQFLLEQSQDPTLQNQEIERFYYNEMYGVRLSVKPLKGVRLHAARRESEMKDREVKNHTTQLGLSLADIFKSGISIYGNFNMNRGDASESDTYYVSVSKNFGRLSWQISFANYYNGVRYIGTDTPEVYHLPDRQTLSTNLFFIVCRSLALSLDYAFSYQKDGDESDHQIFVRAILRK